MDIGKVAYDLACKIRIEVEIQFVELEHGDIDAGTFEDVISLVSIDGGEF